jgi:tetratricopeptide (TPR) repeat protein
MTAPLRLPDPPAALAETLAAGGAIAWREPVEIATYSPAAPDRYPMFFDRRVYQGSSGRVYPIPFVDRVDTESAPRLWDAVHLENRWLRLMVLPELGGRIHVGYDKTADYDFFYRNDVIKPALVGLAGPWVSGGVEFNWPQHHRPATFLPVETAIESGADGSVTVWCSDHDPFTRMKGMHGVRLRADRAVVELAVRLHNRTDDRQTFLWWANVAARAHEDYQSFFPTDVRFVADHARRALTAFPAADRPYYGVDYPARAADGGDQLDRYARIPVPTSYMVTDTADDFFGGYDHRADAGFVHVADRRIAPGKKQWTWGDAPFGHAWDRHLTDGSGPYVELMAGVYTDNQPDFSWLEPGETKAFVQTWYPIQRIGPVHQATADAAVRLDLEDGRARVGVAVTAVRDGARLVVTARGRRLLDEALDLSPGSPAIRTAAVGDAAPEDVEVVLSHGDAVLVRWRPRPEAPAREPWTATEPPAPERIDSVDELYLTGVHLEQYRHPTRSPLPYWREALRRDPGDARSHLALGHDALVRGEYARAEEHVRSTLARLTARNANPRDGEASYLLGLVLMRTARAEAATDAFAKAAWDVRWAGPAGVQLARLAARAGRHAEALARASAALDARAGDSRARTVRVVALRALGRGAEADAELAGWLAEDPLDQLALALAGREGSADPRTALDVALELGAAGDRAGALRALDRVDALPPTAAGDVRPLAAYHRAVLHAEEGDAAGAAAAGARGRAADPALCFPSGLDDHDALRAALDADPGDTRAAALLALLLVDRGRRAEALALWRGAFAAGLRDAVAFRCAAVLAWELEGDATAARAGYDRALAEDRNARLLYERDQLLARTGAGVAERLALLERHPDLLLERDDLAIAYCRLLARAGRADEASGILTSRRFAPWEGGEGQAIAAWEEVAGRMSEAARAAGDLEAAVAHARRAIALPESLGEARHPLTDTRELHDRLATLLEELGRPAEAAEARDAAVVSDVPPVAASLEDDDVDYFATSLPDLLLFSRRPGAAAG